jgi:cytoskeletal protein RodZ
MYQIIIEMLEENIPLEDIAERLDIPVRQVREIEADFYEFV